MREKTSSLYLSTQKCKTLARTIKQQRSPPWPPRVLLHLPTRELADELVACYMRTTESIYRILHLPTFRADYERLWSAPITDQTAFLVQVKLVLAIGSVTYDENFSLRASATQWVYEAQLWLAQPEFKSRLNIAVLQVNMLLLLARELAHIGEDMIWSSAGSVLRTAMYMGLHRDPTNMTKQSTLVVEMRRRLWYTLLELVLQSSITSGGSPLIDCHDYDTKLPRNLNDEQLLEEHPEEQGDNVLTHMSVALALSTTIPVRHAIAMYLNSLSPHGSYSGTLELDTEIKKAYKDMRRILQHVPSINSDVSSGFGVEAAYFVVLRYMLALHFPFYGPALHQTVYTYSRKIVLETSLKLWCAAYPWSVRGFDANVALVGKMDLARITICGSGFFHSIAFTAGLIIAVEQQAQLSEEESLGHVPLGPDLFSVMEDKKAWELKCLEAGGCSTKGYLMACVLAANCRGLAQRLPQDELASTLVKTAEQAVETCIPILQSKAGITADDIAGADEVSSDFPMAEMTDEAFDQMVSWTFYFIRLQRVHLSHRWPNPSSMLETMNLWLSDVHRALRLP
nr:transcription factor lepe [Quercus suber]